MVQSVQKMKYSCSPSLRSRGTVQGGSPGINRTSLRRQSKSHSLSSRRKSFSNSRKSTLAGSTRRINKIHQSIKDRDYIHCGNAKSCFPDYTGVPGQDYTLHPSYEVFMCYICTVQYRMCHLYNAA